MQYVEYVDINSIEPYDPATMSPLTPPQELLAALRQNVAPERFQDIVDIVKLRGVSHPGVGILYPEKGKKILLGDTTEFEAAKAAGLPVFPLIMLDVEVPAAAEDDNAKNYILASIEIDSIRMCLSIPEYDKAKRVAQAVRLQQLLKYKKGLPKRQRNLMGSSTDDDAPYSSYEEASRISGVPIQQIKAAIFVARHGSQEIQEQVASGGMSSLQARERVREARRPRSSRRPASSALEPTLIERFASIVSQFATWRMTVLSTANAIRHQWGGIPDEDKASVLNKGMLLSEQVDDFRALFDSGMLHWLVADEVDEAMEEASANEGNSMKSRAA